MSKAEPLSNARIGEFAVPRHVAIIMDGNGRWAAARGLPRSEGHRRGVEALRRTVRAAGDLGIGILTLFSFSSENWSRPAAEIRDLMGLLRRFIGLLGFCPGQLDFLPGLLGAGGDRVTIG